MYQSITAEELALMEQRSTDSHLRRNQLYRNWWIRETMREAMLYAGPRPTRYPIVEEV